MNQLELNHAVARQTGESVRTIDVTLEWFMCRKKGFQSAGLRRPRD